MKEHYEPETELSTKDINMDAKVYGNAAVVNGAWEWKMENQKPYYIQFMDMLIQRNDTWQVVASQSNFIPVWRVHPLDDSVMEAVTAESCETESALKSLRSDVPAYLRFKNNTSGNVAVYWINFSGQRDTSAHEIFQVAPGKSFDIQAYLTHPFIVIGANNKCYSIYRATTNPSMAIIKD